MIEAHASPGIDVVDLGNPRTRDRNLDGSFLARIFSDAEREAIVSSSDPNREIWRCWSLKEAAFKAIGSHLRPAPPPVFTHRDFVVGPRTGGEESGVHWKDLRVEADLVEDSGRRIVALAVLPSGVPLPGHGVGSVEEVADSLGLGPTDDPRKRLSDREAASVHSRASGLVRLAARRSLAGAMGAEESRLEIVAGEEPGGRTPPSVLFDGVASPDLNVSLSHDGPWIAWAWIAVPGGTGSRQPRGGGPAEGSQPKGR